MINGMDVSAILACIHSPCGKSFLNHLHGKALLVLQFDLDAAPNALRL